MRKRISLYVIPVILGLLLTTVSCGDSKAESPAPAGQAKQAPSLPVVTLATKTVTGFTSYPTRIEGIVNAQVFAKISGYITNVVVDEGQKVRKGQTLFKLETQSLNQDADAAKANVNAAQVEVDKLKPLVEKNIISNVQLETAKAQLQQAKSSYNAITANINYGTIKSPVDGYVGSINLRTGSLVSPSSQEPLTIVSDISKVYAYFSMNEKEYLDFIQETEGKTLQDKVNNFPPVLLQLANGQTYGEKGKIETVSGQINQNTGTVSFRAVFDNPNHLLTNGNSGVIKIPHTYENAVVIPQNSTFEQQGNIIAYKVGEENKVTSTKVVTKATVGNLYVVESGLKKGDKIVAEGVSKLRPDTKIKPQEVSFDSVAKPVKQLFQ